MTDPKTLRAAGDTRQLIVQPDVIDLRDRYYVPTLMPLKQHDIPDASHLIVRDQGRESACTGFAMAAVIDRQCIRGQLSGHVSTRMLFEMAKLHDDLPDHMTAGSTLRGALKGFYHNGVCMEKDAPFLVAPNAHPWELDIKTAKQARNITLGAYFRLNHEINDYHAAINEAGAIIVSGKIHAGWATPRDGTIVQSSRTEGRHAFAIVGYTWDGFLIQNSWGKDWGNFGNIGGVAEWRYEDWFENVEDAWVMRLAVSSPTAFDVKFARNHAALRDPKAAETAFAPRRQDVHGHYLHLDDGAFVSTGRYNQNEGSVNATVNLIKKGPEPPNDPPYRHVLIVAHGAMSGKFAVAKRIHAWKSVFKCNGIYPIHIMWETGFNSDIVDVVKDLLFRTRERMGAGAKHIDARLEEMARPLGHKLWRDLKVSAGMTFAPDSDGGKALRRLIQAAQTTPRLKLHFASISAGAFLLAELADVLAELDATLETASLLAPACSVTHYQSRIQPRLGTTIKGIRQYSLIESRERKDTLDVYSKSLLYLVSNALECQKERALLGMKTGLDTIPEFENTGRPHPDHEVFFAGADRAITDAKSHRDFERDRKTMNDVLCHILQTDPGSARKFSDVHFPKPARSR